MADTPDKTPQTDQDRARAEKAQRLAAALRDNLKRRKAAGRAARSDEDRN